VCALSVQWNTVWPRAAPGGKSFVHARTQCLVGTSLVCVCVCVVSSGTNCVRTRAFTAFRIFNKLFD
jgi:hypothetical protein